MAVVIVPAIILLFSEFKCSTWKDLQFYVSIIFGILGFILALWTMWLFAKIGKGTLAPWNPPKKLVISGPYCYIRNPMLTSIWLIQLGEAFYFQSINLGIYLVIFIIFNMIYFPLIEERGLRKRFGKEYEEYCKHVPRYLPKLKSWKP
ncbi:isoprenylcysteine carboxylmethyltransferase family protein [Lentisphaerota bacterium WC36G]|nr:isoprenylcysteine carboxylmethyltransferase family protein [Lentisphaerae bacterium WC36]